MKSSHERLIIVWLDILAAALEYGRMHLNGNDKTEDQLLLLNQLIFPSLLMRKQENRFDLEQLVLVIALE